MTTKVVVHLRRKKDPILERFSFVSADGKSRDSYLERGDFKWDKKTKVLRAICLCAIQYKCWKAAGQKPNEFLFAGPFESPGATLYQSLPKDYQTPWFGNVFGYRDVLSEDGNPRTYASELLETHQKRRDGQVILGVGVDPQYSPDDFEFVLDGEPNEDPDVLLDWAQRLEARGRWREENCPVEHARNIRASRISVIDTRGQPSSQKVNRGVAEPLQFKVYNEAKRNDLLKILLPTDSRINVIPPAHHKLKRPPVGKSTYQNAETAMGAIAKVCKPNIDILNDSCSHRDAPGTLLILASAASNKAAREYLGNPWENEVKDTLIGKEFRAEYHYRVVPLRRLVLRVQNGRETWVPDYCVINRQGHLVACPKHDDKGKLREDVLVVKRYPRELGGGDSIFFEGLHGPATGAVALLLRGFDCSVGEELFDRVDGRTHFEAIWTVGELTEIEGVTVAGEISLRTDELARPRLAEIIPLLAA
jgi:hypothetical protein